MGVKMSKNDVIAPQKGPQEEFLSSDADIVIFGGSAGGGKSFGLLLDPLRHIESCPDAGAVYFRRTMPEITSEGGLFDEAKKLYIPLGAQPKESKPPRVIFKHPEETKKKDGFKITFSHMQREDDKYKWQGSQIPVIYFDELTHFSRTQFFYLVGRNRSTCGIKPYVRGTCNPDKTSWVRKFIDWWIGEDGYAIIEKSGVIRWLVVHDDIDHWFDSKEEAQEKFPESLPISVTFILSRLKDNQKLLKADPSYKAKLMSLSKVERERLLGDEERGGNWDILPAAGMYFKKYYFQEIDFYPNCIEVCRCWDRAATDESNVKAGEDPDYTASVKLGKLSDGTFVILDITKERLSPAKVETMIINTARQDGISVVQKCFQDPGSAGVNEKDNFIKMLSGFVVDVEKISMNKETAAKPASAQAEHGNISIYKDCRNKELFYVEAEDFPVGSHDDMIDAFTGAFNYLNRDNVGEFSEDYSADLKEIDAFGEDEW